MILAFTTVGALIVARQPAKLTGWLLCAGAGQSFAGHVLVMYLSALPVGVTRPIWNR
jgi:hypothetical protein